MKRRERGNRKGSTTVQFWKDAYKVDKGRAPDCFKAAKIWSTELPIAETAARDTQEK